jgi:hypothetical protein
MDDGRLEEGVGRCTQRFGDLTFSMYYTSPVCIMPSHYIYAPRSWDTLRRSRFVGGYIRSKPMIACPIEYDFEYPDQDVMAPRVTVYRSP